MVPNFALLIIILYAKLCRVLNRYSYITNHEAGAESSGVRVHREQGTKVTFCPGIIGRGVTLILSVFKSIIIIIITHSLASRQLAPSMKPSILSNLPKSRRKRKPSKEFSRLCCIVRIVYDPSLD